MIVLTNRAQNIWGCKYTKEPTKFKFNGVKPVKSEMWFVGLILTLCIAIIKYPYTHQGWESENER